MTKMIVKAFLSVAIICALFVVFSGCASPAATPTPTAIVNASTPTAPAGNATHVVNATVSAPAATNATTNATK